MNDLDELLKDELREEMEAEQQPAEEVPQQQDAAPQQDTGEEEGSTPEPEQDQVNDQPDIAALQSELEDLRKAKEGLEQAVSAERRKRQEFQQQQPKPDFWENPEAALSDIRSEFSTELLRTRIDMSETYARRAHEDFDQVRDEFLGMCQQNPALYAEMQQQSDPAEWAYQQGKAEMERRKYGSIDNLLTAERAKWEQEMREKLEKELADKMQLRGDLPGSIADARAVDAPVDTGDATLEDIFKR